MSEFRDWIEDEISSNLLWGDYSREEIIEDLEQVLAVLRKRQEEEEAELEAELDQSDYEEANDGLQQ